jgi:hypothetical protein
MKNFASAIKDNFLRQKYLYEVKNSQNFICVGHAPEIPKRKIENYR